MGVVAGTHKFSGLDAEVRVGPYAVGRRAVLPSPTDVLYRWLGFAARLQITVVVIGRGGRSAQQVLKRPVPGHHSGPHVEVFHLETNQVR